MPPLIPKPRTPRRDHEHELQCALREHLDRAGVRRMFFFAVPNGGHRRKATAGKLKAEGVKAGVPDLVVLLDGRAYGLELKVKGNYQNAAQKAVQTAWEGTGAVYAVATGLDEALDVLRSWGALRPDYSFVPSKRRQLPLPMEVA